MLDEARIQEVLDNFDSNRTPEDVCGNDPELLREVPARWDEVQRVRHQLDALFPDDGITWRGYGDPGEAAVALPQIDGYDVECVLGRGGMGVVFKAKDRRCQRIVAIKMMLAGPYADPLELARFRREAEAMAALRHPNIVQIHDASAGRHHFTMEFVDGGSLAEKLAGKPLAVRDAAAMAAKLARAVQFAHQNGFIHRDLKPANILLTTDGTPKIADFGLARAIETGPEITFYGDRLGTPCYMAPEQAMGKTGAIGPAVDVYALGAVLYEMLTGRPPFKGQSAAETERQVVVDDPVPPSRWNPKVPRDLEAICLKCLEKSPSRRYASAQDLADDLHHLLDGQRVMNIGNVSTLDDAVAAFNRTERRKGKTIIRVRPSVQKKTNRNKEDARAPFSTAIVRQRGSAPRDHVAVKVTQLSQRDKRVLGAQRAVDG
jgi:serine/threonine-protein kinase